MEFQHVRVGDVLDLARRKVSLTADSTYEEIGLRSFGKGIFHKSPVLGADLGDKKVFRIEPGDLVISNVFAWEGAVAVAGSGEANKIGSHRFMTWVADASIVDAAYLYHYFLSEAGLRQLAKASPGSAGRNKTLGIRAFQELKVPLPPIEEQRRIRARIDTLETWREANDRSLTAARRLEASLTAGLYGRFEDISPLGDFLTPVADEVRVRDEETYTTAGVRWYGEGVFAKDAKRGSEIKAKTLFRLRPGDFIYNKLFAWKGSFAIVPPQGEPLVASNEFPSFRIDESRVLPEYVAGWFRQPHVWETVERLSTGGTPNSRNRLKPAQLLQLQIPVPSLEEQRKVTSQMAQLARTAELQARRSILANALPQAARNEVFATMAKL
jgi:type I restriction enzyme, S subunit